MSATPTVAERVRRWLDEEYPVLNGDDQKALESLLDFAERAARDVADAVKIIDGLMTSDHIPQSCGACGTPNASCDGDCAAAGWLAQDVGKLRKRAATARTLGLGETDGD